MRIYNFEVQRHVDPSSASLFDNFRKEVDEEPHEFDMFVEMEKKIDCNF